MPRTKLPRGQPRFISRGHTLSDTAKAKVLELLGTQDAAKIDAAKIIGEVEAALGICVHGAEHMDNPPRPADYVRAFKSLESKSRELSEELFNINYYYEREFSKQRVDPNILAQELFNCAELSKTVIQEFGRMSSRGARRNTALLETIWRLKAIFRSNYGGPVTQRRKQGAFVHLPEWEKCQHEFIGIALRDARCIPQSCTNGNLQRLIRDPRCSLFPGSGPA